MGEKVKEERGQETDLSPKKEKEKKMSWDTSGLFSETLGLLGLVNRKEKLLS